MTEDTLESNPFTYKTSKDGVVRIFRSNRLASTLKGKLAQRFLSKLRASDGRASQLIMAKITGQFKFGNEKLQKNSRK